MAQKQARILIIDDERMFAEMLKSWLTSQPNCSEAGYATSANEGQALCRATRPDLVMLDIELPGSSGLDLADELLAESPQLRVLLMSGLMDPLTIWRVWQSSAHGYIDKTQSLACMAEAIHAVLKGKRFFSQVFKDVKEHWLSKPDSFHKLLSHREQEVLGRVVSGWEDQRIGKSLNISSETVAFHRKNIRKKLGLHCDREMVAYARRWGFG